MVIAVSDVKVNETNGPSEVAFTVSLSEPAGELVSVDYATADSTAPAPTDYTARGGHDVLRRWRADQDGAGDGGGRHSL